MRILLAEDDQDLGYTIKKGLKTYHYTVDWLTTGTEALYALKESDEIFDMAILDLGLPGTDGLDIIKKVRQAKISTPILVLTARDSNEDIIKGLDAGADDYLVKPFDFDVLNSRIAALLRRQSSNTNDFTLTIDDITINTQAHTVTVFGDTVAFSRQEFKILYKLMEKRGHVVGRQQMTQLLYGWGDDVDSNTIEVHMHSIRKKIKNGLKIKTIRGVGYIIEA
ncbi:response regulator transcription factor [Candidatus Synchoanobacter obligatus]|uniref:Response regulator transcription factor n=1 Tax=Candidatus Synchoanobacter obligatus TaxID=2919597 RepID=A0ABT1L661_9GAMM|nr:response regulator transcription factor [Candidatus Synchoanobacter obligatus]MCP8352659.1 response regulator transcription factor [Candidatus Synchoanobacter obligatus]